MINPEVRDIGIDRNVGSCVLFVVLREKAWQGRPIFPRKE